MATGLACWCVGVAVSLSSSCSSWWWLSVPGRCHRAVRLSPRRVIEALHPVWPSTQTGRPWQPWQPRCRTNRQLSLALIFPPSAHLSFCADGRRQTADCRRQSQTAGGCLVASGAAGWPMTPGLAIVNGRPCGTKAHVPPAVGREIDGSARPSCCLLLLVPQCPSVLVRGAWLPTQPRSPAVHCTSTLVIDVL
jgi:hypothetical protein